MLVPPPRTPQQQFPPKAVAARQRFDLYKAATTDPSGRFHLDRVPPGDYTALAWDEISDEAWQDPEFLAGSEGQGVRLRVAEGATTDIQVPVIPR
jgi:hypothetical protein